MCKFLLISKISLLGVAVKSISLAILTLLLLLVFGIFLTLLLLVLLLLVSFIVPTVKTELFLACFFSESFPILLAEYSNLGVGVLTVLLLELVLLFPVETLLYCVS